MLYRYRSINKILEFKELENQTIYFSTLEDLNDPVEGFINFKWFGDTISWKGLFKHYICCLEHSIFMRKLGSGLEELQKIPLYMDLLSMPPKYKENLEEIIDIFFKQKSVNFLIEKLVKNKEKLEIYEVEFFLKVFHVLILDIIELIYKKNIEKSNENELSLELYNMEDIINAYFHNDFLKEEKEITLNIFNSVFGIKKIKNKSMNFIINDFPSFYVKKLKKITYPTWFIACFTENFDNPVMWGSYGDCNKGICLVFKSSLNNDKKFIELFRKIGVNGNGEYIYDYEKCYFKEVNYSGNFEERNFFNSLGRLNNSQIELWLNDNGKLSKYYDFSDDWRNKYWDDFNKIISTKNTHWSYEKEYRLTLDDSFFPKDDNKDRILKYKFNILDGIIFGINTSTEDKDKIIDIIAKKCIEENRQEFNFYKMEYSTNMTKMRKVGCLYSLNKLKSILKGSQK